MRIKKQKDAVAIDFDGVMFPYRGWRKGELYSPPTKKCVKNIRYIHDHGIKIIIFTVASRIAMKDKINDWVREHFGEDFKYRITNRKPRGVKFIIDDRGLTFRDDRDWVWILKLLF